MLDQPLFAGLMKYMNPQQTVAMVYRCRTLWIQGEWTLGRTIQCSLHLAPPLLSSWEVRSRCYREVIKCFEQKWFRLMLTMFHLTCEEKLNQHYTDYNIPPILARAGEGHELRPVVAIVQQLLKVLKTRVLQRLLAWVDFFFISATYERKRKILNNWKVIII